VLKSLWVLVFLSLSVASFTANAQDKMNLPLYVVPAGNFLLDSDFHFTKVSRDLLDSSGQRTAEQRKTQMLISNDLRFGLATGLDLGVNVSYWIQDETERTPLNTSQDTVSINSAGLQELAIKARYRLPFELMQGMYSNVGFNIAPSFSTAESATVTEDANHYHGGHQVDVSFSTGMVSQDFSWQATLGVEWDGAREEEPSTSSTVDEKTESAMDFGLELEAVTGLSDTFYAGAVVGYQMIGAREYFDPTSDAAPTNEYSSYSIIDITLKFDFFLSDNLALNFGLGYAMVGDRDITVISSGAVANSIDGQNNINADLGIQFLF
jgi:hypothetical protein